MPEKQRVWHYRRMIKTGWVDSIQNEKVKRLVVDNRISLSHNLNDLLSIPLIPELILYSLNIYFLSHLITFVLNILIYWLESFFSNVMSRSFNISFKIIFSFTYKYNIILKSWNFYFFPLDQFFTLKFILELTHLLTYFSYKSKFFTSYLYLSIY